MNTGAGVGGDRGRCRDEPAALAVVAPTNADVASTHAAAAAEEKLAAVCVEIDQLYEDATVENMTYRPFYEDGSGDESVHPLF